MTTRFIFTVLGVCLTLAAFGSRAEARITFEDERAQESFVAYRTFLERDPASFATALETVDRLERSDVEYRIRVDAALPYGVEGTTTTDGTRVTITLPEERVQFGLATSRTALMAHELEHARQFDAGELDFVRDDATGHWEPDAATYDIGDEVKAWKAQLAVATGADAWHKGKPSLLAEFAHAKSDVKRARVLAVSGYANVPFAFECDVVAAAESGRMVGELVRPTPGRHVFGRVRLVR